MKIIIGVTTDIFFDERVKRIASSLVENQFEVQVIGRKRDYTRKDAPLPFNAYWLNCYFNKGFLFYAEYNVRLFLYLIRHSTKNDILNACDLDTVLAVSLICIIKQSKWTFDAHEYFEEVPELLNRPIVKKIWSLIGKICVPKASTCYTVSESLVEVLGKKYNKSFQLIRNLPLENRQIVQSLPAEKVLYYQGALNKGRGLELLIESLTFLPDYTLVLAGTGDLVTSLKELVIRLHVQNRVRFLGRISLEEMYSHASKARIGFNICNPESLSYYYSLSNKTFEYIQAGLPAVHSDLPEYRKLIQKFPVGKLLPTYDLKALLLTIQSLEDPHVYELCVEACKKASIEFQWKNEAEKLITMYIDFRAT